MSSWLPYTGMLCRDTKKHIRHLYLIQIPPQALKTLIIQGRSTDVHKLQQNVRTMTAVHAQVAALLRHRGNTQEWDPYLG
jgi:hypothetical protein